MNSKGPFALCARTSWEAAAHAERNPFCRGLVVSMGIHALPAWGMTSSVASERNRALSAGSPVSKARKMCPGVVRIAVRTPIASSSEASRAVVSSQSPALLNSVTRGSWTVSTTAGFPSDVVMGEAGSST